jgi:hypothetical protein
MMARIAFDTLAYANKLKVAGVEPKIAEAQAEAQAELISELMEEKLATKDDIRQLQLAIKDVEQGLKHDINDVRQSLKSIEDRLIIRLGGLLIIGIGALATLMTVLHH